MLGYDGTNSIPECVVSGVRGFLLLRLIVADAIRDSKRAMPIRNGEPPGMRRPGSSSQVTD
jgi:hypothetical protein